MLKEFNELVIEYDNTYGSSSGDGNSNDNAEVYE